MKKLLLITVPLFLFSCNDNQDFSVTNYPTLSGKVPLIIAHRGASGVLPEHTLEAYAKAIEDGADFIETDLVMTKDGHLIARHEPMLSGTTNVSKILKFASKKTTKNLDGFMVEDWFACDFTLAEIKELKATQALPERDQSYNELYDIPTIQEIIALIKAKKTGRAVGFYAETKHPTFHEDRNLKISDELLKELSLAGWNSSNASVFVESFEVSNLQYIHSKSTVKLVQLLDAYDVKKDGTLDMTLPNGKPYDFVVKGDSRTYNDLVTNAGLDFIKTYANAIGPWKPYIIPYTFKNNSDGSIVDLNGDGKIDSRDFTKLPSTDLIKRAHDRKLLVHVYTFRDEPKRLLADYKNNPLLEYKDFFNLGADGVFTDFTSTAVKAK